MVQRRIGLADLVPGEPLAWDLSLADHSPGPPWRKGQIICDGAQLARLLQMGLYTGAPEQPCVLQLLNASAQRLERLRSGEVGLVTQRGAAYVHPLSNPQGAARRRCPHAL